MIKVISKCPNITIINDLLAEINSCGKSVTQFEEFPLVHLFVKYVTLSVGQSLHATNFNHL
jgi:hypothetical protein